MKIRQLEQFKASDKYSNFILFNNSTSKKLIPWTIFWSSVIVIFGVVHLPKDKLQNFIAQLLQTLPAKFFEALFNKDDPQHIAAQYMAGGIVNKLLIPLKEFLFYAALLVIFSIVIKSIWRERHFWNQLKAHRIALSALSIFLILSVLIFPGGLHSEGLGLVGMGTDYARMSGNPFAENTGWYYRRLLKPAIAHFLYLDEPIRYYLLSLFGTYLLIFMMVTFIEAKIKYSQEIQNTTNKTLKFRSRYLYYLSIATSSYLITDFLWPGYADHLSFILIFLMACLPMNSQERLAIVALCMVNHEGSAFSLIPIILFCFPKQDIKRTFLLFTLYFGLWFASYGLSIGGALAPNIVRQDDSTSLQLLIEHFDYAIAGVFFAYKLFWIIFLYMAFRLWFHKHIFSLVATTSMVLFPIFILPIGWDTTRLMGLGCFGMLIVLAILIDEHHQLPKRVQGLLLIIATLNLVIPSFSVVLERQESFSNYPYPGLYKLIVWSLNSFN